MKKTIILAAAVAALAMLVSCQKENPAQVSEDLVFTASIDAGTKTTIDASTGKVAWENNDEITVTDGTRTAVYSISAINGGKATFAYKSGQALASRGVTYTATYGPSDITSQTYSTKACDLPMIASSGTTSLKFFVTCGLLKLTLTKTGESIKTIAVSDGTDTYTLTCATAVDIASGTDFFIALPARTYTSIVLTNASNKTCAINATSGGVVITTNRIKPLTFGSRISFAAATTGTAKA